MRGRNQCKIPSQQLRNFSKEPVFTEMGLLGHVTCGEHLGNSLKAHLGQDTWGPQVWQTHGTCATTSLSLPMADITNPSPHSCGILLSAVFQTVTANLSALTREVKHDGYRWWKGHLEGG